MQIMLDIPEQYTLGITADDLTQRFKLYIALLMFQTGQFSAGAACEFAGIDRYTFLTACKQHQINVIDYTKDELEADFAALKKDRIPNSHVNRC